MPRLSKRSGGQLNGPVLKKTRSISKEYADAKKANKDPNLPEWSTELKDVHIIDKEWVVGYAQTLEGAQDAIDTHSRYLICDYVKSHPGSGTSGKKSKADSRLLWHSKQIPFDGTPFSVSSYHHYKCAYSFRYKLKKNDDTDSSVSSENPSPEPNENQPQGKYTCCPGKLTMKEIIKYPTSALSMTASKQQKLASLKKLKQDLKTSGNVETESRFIVSMPLSSVHNHEFHGKYRLLNKDVRKNIKELHANGLGSPKKIKQKIEKLVSQEYKLKLCPPKKDDQSFYPTLKTIHSLVNGKKPNGLPPKKVTVSPEDFQPATLEEAVAIFCTDEEYTNESLDVAELVGRIGDKLETLKKFSHALSESEGLIELHNTLTILCEQYRSKYLTSFLSADSISDNSQTVFPNVSSQEELACSSVPQCPGDQMDLLRQQIMLGHDPL